MSDAKPTKPEERELAEMEASFKAYNEGTQARIEKEKTLSGETLVNHREVTAGRMRKAKAMEEGITELRKILNKK